MASRYAIFCKHRKESVSWVHVAVCGKLTLLVLPEESSTVAKPDLASVCGAICCQTFRPLSVRVISEFLSFYCTLHTAWWMFSLLCHCQQVEVIPGRDRVDFSHGASEGHPEGAAHWLSSPVLYLPLLTLHAGPTAILPRYSKYYVFSWRV